MRISVVGPTHPFKGGIAQHTTVLAQRLSAAGHDVEIVSWARQYPRRLYPGQQMVDRPEFVPLTGTRRRLAWNRPESWMREGRRIRNADIVVFAHVTPIQVPAYRTMIRAIRSGRAEVVVVCHNVLPHERSRVDERLVRSLLNAADRVLTHSDDQAEVARSLTNRPVIVARMAPFLPDGFLARRPEPGIHQRLLFFGLVRPYKGLDVLLRALAAAKQPVRLRVAGEFWGGTAATEALVERLGLVGRVELLSGYLPSDEVPALFADSDALVLPYLSATGSQGVWTGFEFGLPVLASDAGQLAQDVRPGIDGLVFAADDVRALTRAIDELYSDDLVLRMRSNVGPVDPNPIWDRYLSVLLNEPKRKGVPMAQEAAPPGGPLLHAAKIAAEQVLWARVGLTNLVTGRFGQRRELPTAVPPTDVLNTPSEWNAAVAECKRLGLPPHRDKRKNWDSLGAISTILNDLGTDIRVLDAGAARYSSVLPWLSLYGVREIVGNNLEFKKVTRHSGVRFEPGDATNTQYRDGWFDAVTCISVIEHGVPLQGFINESARIIRPGGILVVSTDYDEHPPSTTGKTAYGVPVKIFSPADVEELVAMAARAGLDLMGDLRLRNTGSPVHWDRTGLDYTFIRLAFRRAGGVGAAPQTEG